MNIYMMIFVIISVLITCLVCKYVFKRKIKLMLLINSTTISSLLFEIITNLNKDYYSTLIVLILYVTAVLLLNIKFELIYPLKNDTINLNNKLEQIKE